MAVKPKKRAVSKAATSAKSKSTKVVKKAKVKPAKAAVAKKAGVGKGAKMVAKKASTKPSKKNMSASKKSATAKSKKAAIKTAVSKSPKKKTTSKAQLVAKKNKGIKVSKTTKAKQVTPKMSKPKKPIPAKVTAPKSKEPPKKSKPKKLAIVEFSGKKIEVPKKKQLTPLKPLKVAEEQVQVSSLVGMDIPPYQETSGEEYMNEKQHEHFRKILLKWKNQLLEEMDRTMHHLQDEAANFPDPNDRATQEEEFSLELRARDRERKLIKKIEEALQKIDAGEYGYCDSCGVEIGIRRLEARPTANLCIDCKTLDEIRERQLWG